jgi:hypothetical protein
MCAVTRKAHVNRAKPFWSRLAAAIGKVCCDDIKKIRADVKPGGGRIEALISPKSASLANTS